MSAVMNYRIPTEDLFRIGAQGLEPVGDDTIRLRLDEAERRALTRQSDPGYTQAVREELLHTPEAV